MINDDILDEIDTIVDELRARKGEERSEEARRLAIVITRLEEAYAFYLVFCSKAKISNA